MIDKDQIENLISHRMNKLGCTCLRLNWEKNWQTYWVGVVVDVRPLSVVESDKILRQLERDLWKWDKVRFQFYITPKVQPDKLEYLATRDGCLLTQKQWDKEYKLNLAISQNKNVWRKEYGPYI